jgi:hypothetical protein
MMAHDAESGNAPSPDSLLAFARQAAAGGLAAHEAERQIFSRVLALGREAFALFLRLNGTGDLGEEVTLDDASKASRLGATHARPYRSVFGDFSIPRTCYGTREGQKITFAPLDARLRLPEGDYSYLLQGWDAALGAECAFARVAETIERILGVEQPVDSLERNGRHMAASAEAFREARPLPAPEEEGVVFVVSADGKGVVMRRGPDDAPPKAHRGKGDKANKKRMAIVGAVYSVGRHERTPEEVVAALFRDPRTPVGEKAERPAPVGKHLWARLSQAKDGNLTEPMGAVFGWMKAEMDKRGGPGPKEVVCVMDGQEALWEGMARHFGEGVVEVLDLLHVTPRLWQAAHLFEKEGGAEAACFVRERLLRVLKGGSKGVVKGLRRLGTVRGLAGRKRKDLARICNYLEANEGRMRYGEHLKKGYPIASGVIEGACRHYVKDRMERSGMRWTRAGAQAMLDVRGEYLNGDWVAFQAFRIERETQRLYPHRHILDTLAWPVAA